jgi:hypothetical protein
LIFPAAGFFGTELFEKRPMMRMELINSVTRRRTYGNVWDYDVHDGIEFSPTT